MRFVLFCNHSSLVAVLERELAYFKAQFEHERTRAEQAIDELLRVRVQAGPVAPPREPAVPEDVRKLLENPEFTGAGDAL